MKYFKRLRENETIKQYARENNTSFDEMAAIALRNVKTEWKKNS